MDTTEQRTGFRLPWTDRRDQDGGETGAPAETAPAAESGTESGHVTENVDPVGTGEAMTGGLGATPTSDPGIPAAYAPAAEAPRRPTRFLADLNRAMHAAAEEGRQSALDQFHADGKRTVEEIEARSTDDAAALRRQAEEDVTSVREWSKAEIARVREETERRIADRKAYLDRQLEGHTAVTAREIENVHEQVAAFDVEMEAFFDRLLAEEDPSRFAAVAASLPEPPPFTPVPEAQRFEIEARALAGQPAVEPEAPEPEAPQPEALEVEAAAAEAPVEAPVVEPVAEPTMAAETAPDGPGAGAAHEPEVAAGGDPELRSDAPIDDGDATLPEADTGSAEIDARLAALGDLAEAERAAFADVSSTEPDGPAPRASSLSARLAGLVSPGRPDAAPATATATSAEGSTETTQVVVTGLTSVASIAAFKRQLGRLDGVRSVAVSSGPSEEFVFAVAHVEGRPLADGIATLTGFAPHIERADAAEVVVSARDPES